MQGRYQGLDLARAVFMTLGLVFHSAGFYTLGGRSPGSALIIYPEQSVFYDYLVWFLHTFRMNAFYLLGGFFFALLITRKGISESLKNRAVKILIPLFSVGLIFNWVIVYYQNYDTYFTFKSFVDFLISDSKWLRHLWFIGNLFGYYLISLFIFKVIEKTKQPHLLKLIFLSFILTPLSVLILSRLTPYLYHETIFIFSFDRGFYEFLPLYILGLYMWVHREIIFSLSTLKNVSILTISSILIIYFTKLYASSQIPWIFYEYLYTIGTTILAIGITLLFKIIGENSQKYTKGIVDASYTMYLFHMPLNLLFFYTIQLNLNLNIHASYILQCALLFYSTYLLHHRVIAKNYFLRLLFNGQLKKERTITEQGGLSSTAN